MKEKDHKNLAAIRLSNIVDMGLTFSAMIRLYKKGSKETLHKKIVRILPAIANVDSIEHFQKTHKKFCNWGIKKLSLAERKREGRIIKHSGPQVMVKLLKHWMWC